MSEEYIKQLEEANNKLTAALDEHRNQVELFRHIMNRCSMRMILDKSGDVLIQYVGNILDNDKDRRMVDAYRTIKSIGTITKQDFDKEMSDEGKQKI
jgi:hypothetical protein